VKYEKGKSWRATQALELVHSDLISLFSHHSIGRYKYALAFINDFLMYTWVHFLQQKLEVFEHFYQLKYFVEEQLGKSIKTLFTNNGGEYVNHCFEKFHTS